jgi:hypothetical protein
MKVPRGSSVDATAKHSESDNSPCPRLCPIEDIHETNDKQRQKK